VVCEKAVRGAAKLAPSPTKLPAVVATVVRKKQRRDTSVLFTSGPEAIGPTSGLVDSICDEGAQQAEESGLTLKTAIGVLLIF